MNRTHFKQFCMVGAANTLLSFILLYVGVNSILNTPITMNIIFAFVLLSLVFGVLTGAFYAIEYYITFGLFVAGILAGFFMMYNQFMTSPNGWGDLAGLLYLYILAGIGLAVGLAIEMVLRFVKRIHRKNK